MYTTVPITHPALASSKDMRQSFPWAVMGPSLIDPTLEAFWPCKTEMEAVQLATELNAGTYVKEPWWEKDFSPGEAARITKEIAKKM